MKALIEAAEQLMENMVDADVTGPDDCWTADSVDKMKFLGCGHFSAVYSHSDFPHYVVKLSLRPGDVAPCYLAWARANPGRHVPAVHYLRKNEHGTIAILDKLYPVDYASHWMRVYEKYSRRKRNELPDIAVPGYEQLHEAFINITTFFDGLCNIDTHEGNIMLDINGDLVITDPLSSASSKDTSLVLSGVEKAFGLSGPAPAVVSYSDECFS